MKFAASTVNSAERVVHPLRARRPRGRARVRLDYQYRPIREPIGEAAELPLPRSHSVRGKTLVCASLLTSTSVVISLQPPNVWRTPRSNNWVHLEYTT